MSSGNLSIISIPAIKLIKLNSLINFFITYKQDFLLHVNKNNTFYFYLIPNTSFIIEDFAFLVPFFLISIVLF